jgi:hypothetical protein
VEIFPHPTEQELSHPAALAGLTINATENAMSANPRKILPVSILVLLSLCSAWVGDTPNPYRVSPGYSVWG